MYITGTVNTIEDLLTIILDTAVTNGYSHTSFFYPSYSVEHHMLTKAGSYFVLAETNNTLYCRASQAAIETNSTYSAPYTRTLALATNVFPLTYHLLIKENPNLLLLVVEFGNGLTKTMILCDIIKVNNNAFVGGQLAFASEISGAENTGMYYHFLNDTELAEGGDGVCNYIPFCKPYHFNSPAGAGNGLKIDYSGQHFDKSLNLGQTSLHMSTTTVAQLFYSPSSWSNQAVLIPLIINQYRGAGYFCTIGSLPHIMLLRIDYYNNNDIITIGADQWKVFSWGKKGAGGIGNTGNIGFAFKIN